MAGLPAVAEAGSGWLPACGRENYFADRKGKGMVAEMTRREIREHVFVMLFQSEFHEMAELPEQNQLYFDLYMTSASEEEKSYIEARTGKIRERLGEIDPWLSDATSGWRLSRMGKVELTILRLAVFEMKFDEEMPAKAAINEAVELAKKFGGDSSAGFINGVLAKLM